MSRIVIVGLTTSPPSIRRLCTQCGIPNISQPYRPPQPITGIAFLAGTREIFMNHAQGQCRGGESTC
jgi:hypothetical protein